MADESLNPVRFAGNLVVAAFFAGDNDKKRRAKRDELLRQFTDVPEHGEHGPARPTKAEQELRAGERRFMPFHWEIEFPEVFGRENGGFDAIVGNPPFLRWNTNHRVLRRRLSRLARGCIHKRIHGNADLVAHFFRRSFTLFDAAAPSA